MDENLERLKEFTKKYARSFRPCFSKESTEQYIRMFASKRWVNITIDPGLDISSKDLKEYGKHFNDFFYEVITEMIKTNDYGDNVLEYSTSL